MHNAAGSCLEKGAVIGDHTAVAGFCEAVAQCRLMTDGTLGVRSTGSGLEGGRDVTW